MMSLGTLDSSHKQAIKLEGALLLVPQLCSERTDMLVGKKEDAESSRHPILINEETDRSILDPASSMILKLYAQGE